MKQKMIVNISPFVTPYGLIVAEDRKNGFCLRFEGGEELVRLKIRGDKVEIQFVHKGACREWIEERINKFGKVVALVDDDQAFIEIDGHRVIVFKFNSELYFETESRKKYPPSGIWKKGWYYPEEGYFCLTRSFINRKYF